jgi:TDG/mug DNA glycosylase family protein
VIADVIAPGLRVLFCGINPGLYSGATGFHFARPGNRFWPALYAAGFTDRLLDPSEVAELPRYGCGITNLVARTTARADEVTDEELRQGRVRLEDKLREFRPAWLAVVGVGAYRVAFDRRKASLGRQVEMIGDTHIWVLPNTSGLNAHHRPSDFARHFADLRAAVTETVSTLPL